MMSEKPDIFRLPDLNENTIAWPVVEQPLGHGRKLAFTPCRVIETYQVIYHARSDRWWRMLTQFNVAAMPSPGSPDDDIVAGRVKSFPSMAALIADLDQPE